MNRLQYLIRAKTVYGVHSPFVFDLCQRVLFARGGTEGLPRGAGRAERRFRGLCRRMELCFGLRPCREEEGRREYEGGEEVGRILVFKEPHRDGEREAEWRRLCAGPDYRVSVDLFDVGVLLANRRLHREHFVLR